MNAIANFAAGETTMSSREIADLTGKEHRNVLADIRKMIVDLELSSAEFSADLADAYGRSQPGFRLPKRETLILVSGYSVQMRARIIDRWQELEAKAATPAIDLADPAFLRSALLVYTEKVVALEEKIEKQAPAVEFATAVRNTADGITLSQMAAVLGIGRNRFYAKLRGDHILMADNLPYQHYKERGYFRVIENVWIDEAKEPHPTFKTLVSGAGQVYLQRKYGADTEAA